jgi:hypothetical protein
VLGSIFSGVGSRTTSASPDRLQRLVVSQRLIAVCNENAHQAECVETMCFRDPCIRRGS